MTLLKTPAEYAAQLNDCYGSQTGVVSIIVDMARAHGQLPLEYVEAISRELLALNRPILSTATPNGGK